MVQESDGESPRHPIQVVARRTGLTPDVIRAWERRYGAVSPSRSSTRRRLYSEQEIERLGLLRRATAAGRRIGDIVGLNSSALSELLAVDEAEAIRNRATAAPEASPSAGPHLEACLAAVGLLDAQTLECRLRVASLELSTPDLIEGVLMPLLEIIGERWRARTMGVHHEHMATSMIRSLLEILRSNLTRPGARAEIVIATPSGQSHELGALTAAVVAAAEGWQVTYLGPDLPAEELAAAATSRNSRALALSIIYPADDAGVVDELRKLGELLPDDVTLLVGGNAAQSYHQVLKRIGAVRLESFGQMRQVLGQMLAPGTQPS